MMASVVRESLRSFVRSAKAFDWVKRVSNTATIKALLPTATVSSSEDGAGGRPSGGVVQNGTTAATNGGTTGLPNGRSTANGTVSNAGVHTVGPGKLSYAIEGISGLSIHQVCEQPLGRAGSSPSKGKTKPLASAPSSASNSILPVVSADARRNLWAFQAQQEPQVESSGNHAADTMLSKVDEGCSGKDGDEPPNKKIQTRVALLVDGDHAMPSEMEHVIEHFHTVIGATVPVRRAYFARQDVAEGKKWNQYGDKHNFHRLVVKAFGQSRAELVDKKLAIDAIRLSLVDRYNIAIVSRDKGFAEVFAELERNGAPQYFAVSREQPSIKNLFEGYGATFVDDRPFSGGTEKEKGATGDSPLEKGKGSRNVGDKPIILPLASTSTYPSSCTRPVFTRTGQESSSPRSSCTGSSSWSSGGVKNWSKDESIVHGRRGVTKHRSSSLPTAWKTPFGKTTQSTLSRPSTTNYTSRGNYGSGWCASTSNRGGKSANKVSSSSTAQNEKDPKADVLFPTSHPAYSYMHPFHSFAMGRVPRPAAGHDYNISPPLVPPQYYHPPNNNGMLPPTLSPMLAYPVPPSHSSCYYPPLEDGSQVIAASNSSHLQWLMRRYAQAAGWITRNENTAATSAKNEDSSSVATYSTSTRTRRRRAAKTKECRSMKQRQGKRNSSKSSSRRNGAGLGFRVAQRMPKSRRHVLSSMNAGRRRSEVVCSSYESALYMAATRSTRQGRYRKSARPKREETLR
ncbi:unnamed protein product [Amoebophrya sp. A25]|nr:unnamed protein product [Amoebophrya sp. A25]|eukprot:GSA25T00023115001.1